MKDQKPIPKIENDPDLRGVRVRDCGEPVAVVEGGGRIHVLSAYHALGFATASKRIHLRIGALDALLRAADSLPSGLTILVWDGLRSLNTQREIAERFMRTLSQGRMTHGERDATLTRYVSALPSSIEEHRSAPPPHATGGALDVTLADARGCALDLGAEFDQFDDAAQPSYFEPSWDQQGALETDRCRCRLRRLLFWAMTGAGFAPFHSEFWHFEFRTRRAAAYYGESIAAYGPAVPFDVGGPG